jgi:hypothetical protein
VIAGVPAKVVRSYDPETGWYPPLAEVPLDDEALAQIAKMIDDGSLTELPKPDELAG